MLAIANELLILRNEERPWLFFHLTTSINYEHISLKIYKINSFPDHICEPQRYCILTKNVARNITYMTFIHKMNKVDKYTHILTKHKYYCFDTALTNIKILHRNAEIANELKSTHNSMAKMRST